MELMSVLHVFPGLLSEPARVALHMSAKETKTDGRNGSEKGMISSLFHLVFQV